MSDIDSEKSVQDESNVPDLNSTQESEISAVPTKTTVAKTGKFMCITSYLGRNTKVAK